MNITRCASHLSDPDIRRMLQAQAINELYTSAQAPPKTPKDQMDVFQDIILDTVGDRRMIYLEFGVAEGHSLRLMASKFTHLESRFYGFDSFEGLPEDWSPYFNVERGTFSTHGLMPDIDDQRVEFIKGWFQNTLPPFLSMGRISRPWPHLIHFDADLYSSTLFILTALWHHLPEYYFIFDEFPFDEVVALRDFTHSHPVEIKFIAECHDKVFGWMRRVPFSL